MRIQPQLGFILTGTAALASLIGCSGGGIANPMSNLAQTGGAGAGVASQSVRASGAGSQSVTRNAVLSYSALRPDMQHLIQKAGGLDALRALVPAPACAKPPFDFVSDYNNNVVYQLRRPTPTALVLCAILTGPPFSNPQGIATDRLNNLYVADTGSSTILRYSPPNYNGTPFVMKDPGEYPLDVAVDPKLNVAVTNIETTSGGPGNVVLYSSGSQLPTGSAQDHAFTSPRFAAFDRSNKLYLDDYDAFGSGVVNVGRISPNYSSFTNPITTLTTNPIGFPGGVQVNSADKVAIDDQIGGLIYTYLTPVGTNLGTPYTTTVMGSSDPVGFAFYLGSPYTLAADAGLAGALLNKYMAGTWANQILFSNSLPIGAGTVPTEQY